MPLTQIEVKLKKVAYALGALQGVTYSLLALICIIIYYQAPISFDGDSYMNTVEANMYYAVLSADGSAAGFRQSLRPRVFHGFAWIHFFLHLILCGVSVIALCKDGLNYTKYPQLWSCIVWTVCLWDFLTVVILGSDYGKCLNMASDIPIIYKIAIQESCANALLPVLVIAAKGFVLWIINLVLGLVLHSMGMRQKLEQRPTQMPSAVVYNYPQQQAVPQPATFQPPYPTTSSDMQRQMSGPQMPMPGVQYYTPMNVYQGQGQPYQPYVVPTSAQSLRKDQFEFPVHIPKPDYHTDMSHSYNERR